MSEEKLSLRIYVSFLKEDGESAVPCVKLLKRTIKTGLKDRYNALFFHPDDVSVGEVIDETLNRRVSELEIAIVLVSNEYLLEGREAERVHAKHPHPIIAKLENIGPGASFTPFDRRDIVPGHSFSQAQDAGRTAEQDFANNVLGMIERELTNRQAYAHTSEPRLTPDEIAEELSAHARLQLTAEAVPARAKRELFEQTQGRNGEEGIGPEPFADITDVVKHLVTWACESTGDSSRLCALLGDLGTGKTTSAILLTRKLLERRKFGEQVPLPFYFDLRDLSPTGLADFGLRTVLTHLLSASTKSAVMVDDMLDAIRSEPALVVFDGLDEALVHLSPGDGQRLTRSLLEVLTLNVPNSGAEPPGTHLLLSCRTQYFRTMNDEAFFANGEESERTHGKDYLVLTMLPFDEDQIREYLRRNIPEANTDRLLETIRSVHNLRELASQPVLLNMIRQVLLTIDEDLSFGQQVRSVDLYERFVNKWLRRDDGKHSLIPRHKIQLMTHLAWQIWRSGSRTWTADQMEDWLIEFLHTHPDMELHYERRMPNQWKQDFRTATFLARRGDNFAFTHSSLLEYFLAKRLADSLQTEPEDDSLVTWDITCPNDETFMFFGELIERLSAPTRRKALARLEDVGAHASASARANVFAYTLRALEKEAPHPRPDALNLANTDLRSWTIGYKTTTLNLAGVSLRSACLDDARIRHARLDRIDATAASIRRTLLEHCTLTRANLDDADLASTVFRHCDIKGASLDKATRYRTQLLHTTGCHQQLSDVMTAPLTKHDPLRILPKAQILGGHSKYVTTVTWSPDGTHILTGSGDGTARIWDTTTGDNTLTLTINSVINAIAWSPDGRHILTGGDGTAHIWDATTGDNTLTLTHTLIPAHWVTAVAWSPDGRHILTGSSEGTAHIWDAITGDNTLTLALIHDAETKEVAWSPNGTHILTASRSGTARIWDATTGTNILTLTHTDWVRAVAWSPDGHHILTASMDGTVRIWDATTGTNTLTLTHNTRVRTVAWSPDSHHILTASADGTARIWDATTGTNTLTLTHADKDGLTAVAWSPDGHHILTASEDGTAHIWDATTREDTPKPRLTLTHTDWVRAVAWSPDGHHILTASDDGTARIWDATTGEQVRFFIAVLPEGECAVLTPDQTRVIGASPYAWRWLGRYAVHPDGTLERIPVEIDGPLPPLGPGAQAE